MNNKNRINLLPRPWGPDPQNNNTQEYKLTYIL